MPRKCGMLAGFCMVTLAPLGGRGHSSTGFLPLSARGEGARGCGKADG
jgi:hypothetical protein